MTQQNEKPDFIEPKEIIAFIDKQKASVQHATGLQLLRRAAETIAFQGDVIEKFSDRDQQIGLQVAEVLGEQFKQAFPTVFGLEDVLIYIAGMREQIDNLQQGIFDRDEIIRDYESPVDVVTSADGPQIILARVDEKYEDPFNAHEEDGMQHLQEFDHSVDPQVVSCGVASGSVDGISRFDVVKRSKEFAHTVKGFVIAAAQIDPHGLMIREVENFIEDVNNI